MKTYLWYSNGTSITGKALALKLGLTRMSPSSSDRQYGTAPPPIGTTHCIVWGAMMKDWNPNNYRWKRNIKYLNNPELIKKYSNKYQALYRMYMHNIKLPEFTNSEDRFELMHDILINTGIEFNDFSDKPIIGRKYHHQGGSGFEFITSETSLRDSDSDYFMEYIDGEDKREYRVHVFNNEVIKVQRKRRIKDDEGNSIEATEEQNRCRSHDNGWMFSNCDISRINSSITRNALEACASLGYGFGGVDIIRIPSSDTTSVLEVNSGMGLDNAGLELYTNKIQGWLNGF